MWAYRMVLTSKARSYFLPMSISTAAPRPCGASCRSSSTWCGAGRSIPARSSISRCLWSRSQRVTGRWMSAARSRRCCDRKGDHIVKAWSKDELRKIAEADDLHISPFREDGTTYGTPTWIWSVAVDNALYVRGYNGQKSRWYQAAANQKAGRIFVAGMTKEVTFEPVEGPINDLIDDAYQAKYRGSPYLKPMIGARTRSATVKVIPRETNS